MYEMRNISDKTARTQAQAPESSHWQSEGTTGQCGTFRSSLMAETSHSQLGKTPDSLEVSEMWTVQEGLTPVPVSPYLKLLAARVDIAIECIRPVTVRLRN